MREGSSSRMRTSALPCRLLVSSRRPLPCIPRADCSVHTMVAMTRILLARHGESDWNVENRWQGHADRPLTETGRLQAELLAERLAGTMIDAVYASDLRRAADTARIVAARLGLRVHTDADLREVDVGSWQGLTREHVAARFPEDYARWVEGGTGWTDGETYEAMAARVMAAIRRIASSYGNSQVLLVSHGGAIRAIHAAALGG